LPIEAGTHKHGRAVRIWLNTFGGIANFSDSGCGQSLVQYSFIFRGGPR
jgi:hypothetical protein